MTYKPISDVAGANSAIADLYGRTDALLRASAVPSVSTLDVLKAAMPIGYIYISMTSTNPAVLFGFGTWQPMATGRTLVGIDTADADLNAAGKLYGEKAHALTLAENAAHNHTDSGHTHSIAHDHAAVTSGGASADHSHSVNINSGTVSSDHSHAYSGSTDSQGSHQHQISFYPVNASAQGVKSNVNQGTYYGFYYINSYPQTDAAGSHAHNFSGQTGGISANHNHNVSGNTAGRSADHTHSVDLPNFTGNSGNAAASIASSGSGTAHNNMQPSFVVYMWQRTA